MRVRLEQIYNVADPLVDLVLIRAGRKVVLVKDAGKLRHPDRLLVCVPVIINVGLHARHVRLEDVNRSKVPASGERLLVELLEPRLVFLATHGGAAEQSSLLAHRSNQAIPQADSSVNVDVGGNVGARAVRLIETHNVGRCGSELLKLLQSLGVLLPVVATAPKHRDRDKAGAFGA